jgi:hypothetical protein
VWRADSLQLSDLLVAHRVVSRVEGDPLTWRDLTIEPSRTLEVTPGASLWVVWEAYGIVADARGFGRYDVTLSLQDAEARSLPVRVLERMGVGRREQGVALGWAAARRLSADGRALEYVAIELPGEGAGEYRLEVTVRVGEQVARSVRRVTVIPVAP